MRNKSSWPSSATFLLESNLGYTQAVEYYTTVRNNKGAEHMISQWCGSYDLHILPILLQTTSGTSRTVDMWLSSTGADSSVSGPTFPMTCCPHGL